MADTLTTQTTLATIPSGSVIATDDAGAGGHVQIVKLAISTDASATPIPADATNGLDVDVTRLPALVAGTANIGDVDVLTVPAPLSTTGGGTEATALRVTLANDSTGVVSVDDNGGSLTVDAPLGTPVHTRISDGTDVVLVSAAGALLVDVASMPNEGQQTMANSISVAVASDQSSVPVTATLTAGTNTNEVVGDVAHNAAAAGNPVLVAASHETPADSAPSNRASADANATRLSAVDGALFVIPGGPQQWAARLTGTMTDTTVKTAPGAGLSLYVQTVVYSIGAATASTILLEESTTTAKFGPHYLEAVNGRGLAITINPPIKIAANTLLSATNTGSTTATLDVYGFTAPG